MYYIYFIYVLSMNINRSKYETNTCFRQLDILENNNFNYLTNMSYCRLYIPII
jgi:hypothetical protein